MDNELKDMIKELKRLCEIGEDLLDDGKSSKVKFIAKSIKKAYNEPAKISVKKDETVQATCHIEGKALPLLITLAGIEKAILNKTHVPKELYEIIKSSLGYVEVKEDE